MTTAIRLNCKIEDRFEPSWPTRSAFDLNTNYEKGIEERFVLKTAPKLHHPIYFMQLAHNNVIMCRWSWCKQSILHTSRSVLLTISGQVTIAFNHMIKSFVGDRGAHDVPGYPSDGNRWSENQSLNRYQSKLVNWYRLVSVNRWLINNHTKIVHRLVFKWLFANSTKNSLVSRHFVRRLCNYTGVSRNCSSTLRKLVYHQKLLFEFEVWGLFVQGR